MHTCAYPWPWPSNGDPGKAASNLRKHGIDFSDATLVFHDDLALTIVDPHREEQRFVTMGRDSLGRVVVVVYVWRGDRIRIISARAATRKERRQYEERK